jgi:hypothetical protein
MCRSIPVQKVRDFGKYELYPMAMSGARTGLLSPFSGLSMNCYFAKDLIFGFPVLISVMMRTGGPTYFG